MNSGHFSNIFSLLYGAAAFFAVGVPMVLVLRWWWRGKIPIDPRGDGTAFEKNARKGPRVFRYYIWIGFGLWALLVLLAITWGTYNTMRTENGVRTEKRVRF